MNCCKNFSDWSWENLFEIFVEKKNTFRTKRKKYLPALAKSLALTTASVNSIIIFASWSAIIDLDVSRWRWNIGPAAAKAHRPKSNTKNRIIVLLMTENWMKLKVCNRANWSGLKHDCDLKSKPIGVFFTRMHKVRDVVKNLHAETTNQWRAVWKKFAYPGDILPSFQKSSSKNNVFHSFSRSIL